MYCNKMCDVSTTSNKFRRISNMWQQICKYPEKTRGRAAKLSSREVAGTHVPAWTTNVKNSAQASSDIEWQGRQIGNHSASSRGSFGAQKRPGPNMFEGPLKKPKIPYASKLGKISV